MNEEVACAMINRTMLTSHQLKRLIKYIRSTKGLPIIERITNPGKGQGQTKRSDTRLNQRSTSNRSRLLRLSSKTDLKTTKKYCIKKAKVNL